MKMLTEINKYTKEIEYHIYSWQKSAARIGDGKILDAVLDV